jgi:hypothetical protein
MLHHGCVLFVLLVGISSSVGSMGGSDQAMMAEKSASGLHNRRRSYLRALQQASEFDVDLFLELQFVGELTASELETKDPGNSAVMHFCGAVQAQVRIMNHPGLLHDLLCRPCGQITDSHMLVFPSE